jgi:lipocalin
MTMMIKMRMMLPMAALCSCMAQDVRLKQVGLRALQSSCPPETFFISDPNLDADEYIAMPWYSIQQIPVAYQPLDSFYCVQATYTLKNPSKNLICTILQNCGKRRINVRNQARKDSVTGKAIDATLQGIFPKDNNNSRLRVGPTWLQGLWYGDYWIIDAGKYAEFAPAGESTSSRFAGVDNAYDWAIISGGPPDTPSGDACLPGQGRTNFNGFWLFARTQNPPSEVVEGMRALAASKGYDVSQLVPVVQEGCADY